MITIFGERATFCDGVHRRGFLKAGFLGLSGLTLADGLQTGVVGASNSKGEVPAQAAYRPENVLAMIYRHLRIDPAQTFPDFSGRPLFILERRDIIRELV